jgi:gamma-glutamyltranspeptidase/glutathione hydrolase
MVSTPHHLASSAGKQALRQGGSAVDAAIAANAVLCVAYPHMAGLGGDGFWLIADTESGDVSALNASGPAGAAATRDRYRDQGGIPERGPAAALTVPGAVDGWRRAHDRHGRLPWRELFTDAIRYASEGVPVSESLARWMHRDADLLRDSAVADVFTPGGTPLNAGTRLVQSDLGSTLERLANKGARSFYEGTTAERLANGNRTPLQPSDFAAYEAEWVEPIRGSYRGRTVYELPPNTQGISTLQILGILANYDVETWKDCSAAYLHHLVEATKLAFADRDEWVSDPAFVEAPLERLLSSSYLANRSGRINAGRTLPASPEPGIEYGGDAVDAGGDTVYLCTADDDGLVVSTIQSIFLDFGSGVVPEDTGVFLQNRGALFSLEPADANRLEPGKRSFHTLIPALLYDRKEPTVAFGTMGGHGQPQTQAAFLTRLLDFGYDIQRAISAPRWLFGRTWSGGSRTLTVESRIGDRTVDALRRRGHDVSVAKVYDEAMGHAQALRVNHETGVIAGAADPRSDGSAVGF